MSLSRLLRSLLKKKNLYKTAYVTIATIFLFWMLFLDSHSWLTHRELNEEIEQLEARKKDLQQTIEQDKAAISQLENLDSLETYARENYGHKRKDETIFIVED
ncbi:MAG: septum formation initiator family protein [Flavobacteriaceae bacterium]|nr:septum formation initiator family protein [Flavobacteriaceae bacterium]